MSDSRPFPNPLPPPGAPHPRASVADAIRQKDWNASQLGARHRWPPCLNLLVDAIQSQPFPMLVVWGREMILFFNEAYLRFSPETGTEALGRPLKDVFPKWIPMVQPIGDRIAKGEPVSLRRQPMATREWGTIYVDVGCSPLRDEGGAVVGALVVLHDAGSPASPDPPTGGHPAPEAITRAQRLARDAVQSGWWHYDPRTQTVLWDERLRALFGELDARPTLERLLEKVHAEDRERVRAELARVVHSDGTATFRTQHRIVDARSGVVRWIESAGQAIFEGEGPERRAVAVYGASTDITARREAEERVQALSGRLEQQARLFDTALSHIADFVYILDPEGRFVYANESLLGLLQQPSADVIGSSVLDTRYPKDWAIRLLRQLGQVVQAKRSIVDEVMLHHADGPDEHYEHILNPIFAPDGRVEAVAGSTRNITERKRTERHAQFLSHLAQRLALIDDPAEILRLSCQALARQLRAHRCYMCEWDADFARVLVREDWRGPGLSRLAGVHEVSRFGAPAWWRTVIRGSVAVPDVENQPELADVQGAYQEYQIRSFVSARFKRDGASIVSLVATSASSRQWRQDEVTLLENVVARVWPLVERAVGLRHANFLSRLGQRISLLVEPEEIVRTTIEAVGRHLSVQRCYYFESSTESGQIAITADWHRPGVVSLEAEYARSDFGSDGWWQEVASGRMCVEDVTRDARLNVPQFAQWSIRSVATVPFIRAGVWVAGLAVAADEPRRWEESEMELLENVIARVWPMIERARVIVESRQHAERLRLALATADLGDFRLDLKRGVATFSPRAAAIFGVSPNGPVPLEELRRRVVEEDRAREMEAAEQAIASRSDYDTEYRFVRPDGETRWIAAKGRGTYTAQGEPDGVIGVVQDITARKRNEVELETARDRAVAASRAKDAFLAALSHELRTPLNPVLLLASDAEADESLPVSVRERFAIVRNNIELEARLIDDLLDLTRISRGMLALDIRPHEVNALLRNAIETVQGELIEKSLRLDVQVEPDEMVVLADAVRLQQVFWNVLKNAVKFTADCGRIEVRACTVPARRRVRIEISDNGIGMTPHELSRAFDAFSQGDHATSGASHRFGGVGLGLSISRMLVEQHGGTISARSEGRGHGSTFVVELPLANGVRLPVETTSADAKIARPAEAQVERGRVLLVEDHAATRSALAALLRRRRFNVITAASAAEARALAERGEMRLIISDIGLPDASGYDLMKEVRERFGLRGIALTGYGTEEDVQRSRDAGFAAHLTKPVTVQALDRALATVENEAGETQ